MAWQDEEADLYSLEWFGDRCALSIPATLRRCVRHDLFLRTYRPRRDLPREQFDAIERRLKEQGIPNLDPIANPDLYGSVRALDDSVSLTLTSGDPLATDGEFRVPAGASFAVRGEDLALFVLLYTSQKLERCVDRLERDLQVLRVYRYADDSERLLQSIAMVGVAVSSATQGFDCAALWALVQDRSTRYPLVNRALAAHKFVCFLCPALGEQLQQIQSGDSVRFAPAVGSDSAPGGSVSTLMSPVRRSVPPKTSDRSRLTALQASFKLPVPEAEAPHECRFCFSTDLIPLTTGTYVYSERKRCRACGKSSSFFQPIPSQK